MSQAASGFVRQDLERYYTPFWPVEALFGAVHFDGPIWDPMAGDGAILRSMERLGVPDMAGTDIAPESPYIGEADFFSFDRAIVGNMRLVNIITNPAYGKGGRLAVKAIEHALHLTMPSRGKVAMLLRADFDSANGRRHIFADHPSFAAKFVLTKRIRWTNLPQSAAGPTDNHQWCLWDWNYPDNWAVVRYLP